MQEMFTEFKLANLSHHDGEVYDHCSLLTLDDIAFCEFPIIINVSTGTKQDFNTLNMLPKHLINCCICLNILSKMFSVPQIVIFIIISFP